MYFVIFIAKNSVTHEVPDLLSYFCKIVELSKSGILNASIYKEML